MSTDNELSVGGTHNDFQTVACENVYNSVVRYCKHCEDWYVKNYTEDNKQWCGFYINSETTESIVRTLKGANCWYKLGVLLDIPVRELFLTTTQVHTVRHAKTMLDTFYSFWISDNINDNAISEMWTRLVKALQSKRYFRDSEEFVYGELLPALFNGSVEDEKLRDSLFLKISYIIHSSWKSFGCKYLDMDDDAVQRVVSLSVHAYEDMNCDSEAHKVRRVLEYFVQNETCNADRLVHIFTEHIPNESVIKCLYKYGMTCLKDQ